MTMTNLQRMRKELSPTRRKKVASARPAHRRGNDIEELLDAPASSRKCAWPRPLASGRTAFPA